MPRKKQKTPENDAVETGNGAENAQPEAPPGDAPGTAPGDAPGDAPDSEDRTGDGPAEPAAPPDRDAAAPEDDRAAPADGEPAAAEPDPAALQAEVADLNDKLLRALAEAENVRRRAERDKQDASKYAIAGFAREILTVADNLRRALESVDHDARKEDSAVDKMIVGLEMTERGMLSTFERFGIKPIQALGERFDHNLHEAMFELEDAAKPAGTVVQVMETGYLLNDRLLRPAKVGVSKGGPKENAVSDAEKTAAPDAARKDGQAAYESKGEEPGAQLDEEL